MADWKYGFGHLEWAGKSYRQDLIIIEDQIITPWRREHGHRLQLSDLTEVLQAAPSVLVIGTGHNGVMNVPDEVLTELAAHGIDGRPMPTAQALEHFTDLQTRGKKVAAALHLTC